MKTNYIQPPIHLKSF